MIFIRLLFLVALILPIAVWIDSVGSPFDYFLESVPAGQFLYVLSKLTGLLGICLLMLQVLLVLLRRKNIARIAEGWNTRHHQWLGVLLVLVISIHVSLFIAGVSLRSGHLALHLLVPEFTSGFYDQMVSLGVFSLVILLCLAYLGRKLVSGKCKQYTKVKHVHRAVAFFSLPFVILHSISIGSETSSVLMKVFYFSYIVVFISGLYVWWYPLRDKHHHEKNLGS